jgi:transcription elongation factor GreA-like protein/transcription elongation GreA/GreB family factor
MSYLEEFKTRLVNHDWQGFMQLWEEYCEGDVVDAPELLQILEAIKHSDFAPTFGKHVETALALWKNIPEESCGYHVYRLIIDLQTTNHPELAELTLEILKNRYQHLPHFNDKIRLVGLRSKDNFQGSVSNFELLTHMGIGKFVFHTGGWGAGEIVELSLVREQLVLEFEKVTGRKDMSFGNAFKNLIPLSDDHFLSRRFGNPDALEKAAKENPVEIIKSLLKDLGPKTAAEIKDELCEWVIPEDEWTKWWQATRAKLKKDTMIESPSSVREPFQLRTSEVSHEERLEKALKTQTDINTIIDTLYSFVRDYSETLKKQDTKQALHQRITNLLAASDLSESQKVQLHIFLAEMLADDSSKKYLSETIKTLKNIPELLQEIQIAAFKKRVLMIVRESREDWAKLLVDLLDSINIHALRDYILKELNHPKTLDLLTKKIQHLVDHPKSNPELFVWYFSKAIGDKQVPFSDKEGKALLLESFMMLMGQIENISSCKDLVKKMQGMLSANRFLMVRNIIEGTSVEYLQEFLLLVSKCQSLNDHDSKILHSLAEVVQPSLAKHRKGKEHLETPVQEIIWTTPEGYRKIQERIQQIGTVDTVENAREIEAARAHGDLRENSEYKFALEKRGRLQGELKLLSQQLNKARTITKDDIPKDEVGVGTVVDLVNSKGEAVTYTLLGPWDANPDQWILSFQSKLAQAMLGHKVGERFQFLDEEYTIKSLRSYLEG